MKLGSLAFAEVALVLGLVGAVSGCCGCPQPAAAPAAAGSLSTTGPVPPAAQNQPGAVVAVKTCPGALAAAADGSIDDLEDGNNQVQLVAGRGGYWWTAKDDNGSTIDPAGELKPSEGGAGSKLAVHVTGKTASGDPGKAWGAIVGLRLAEHGLYDASKYAGISFKAKVGEKSGSAVRLKVADVNTDPSGQVCKDACYNDFGKDFTFTHDWQEYKVSFSEMRQQDGWGDPRPPSITPAKLSQIAWHLSTQGADFDLWLDDVRFLDCQ